MEWGASVHRGARSGAVRPRACCRAQPRNQEAGSTPVCSAVRAPSGGPWLPGRSVQGLREALGHIRTTGVPLVWVDGFWGPRLHPM